MADEFTITANQPAKEKHPFRRISEELSGLLSHLSKGNIKQTLQGIYYFPDSCFQYRPDNEFDEAIKSLSPAWFKLRYREPSIFRWRTEKQFIRSQPYLHFNQTLSNEYKLDPKKHPIAARITEWQNGAKRVDFYFESSPPDSSLRIWTTFTYASTRGFKFPVPKTDLAEEIKKELISEKITPTAL